MSGTTLSRQESDAVSHPSHYRRGGIECREAERAMLTDAPTPPMVTHLWASAFEYLWRWPFKNGVEDLRKCRQCIDEIMDEMEG